MYQAYKIHGAAQLIGYNYIYIEREREERDFTLSTGFIIHPVKAAQNWPSDKRPPALHNLSHSSVSYQPRRVHCNRLTYMSPPSFSSQAPVPKQTKKSQGGNKSNGLLGPPSVISVVFCCLKKKNSRNVSNRGSDPKFGRTDCTGSTTQRHRQHLKR